MKISVWNSISLDGVMQEPETWAHRYNDDVMMREAQKGMSQDGVILFGRRTYEEFYGYWPDQTDNPFTDHLNRATKIVASRTLEEPLPWENSQLLRGEAEDTVAELKQRESRDAVVLGSGDLLHSLIGAGLVDEYTLLIHPLVLGQGQRLLPEGVYAELQLVESAPTTTGVIIATYRPAA